MSESMEQWLLFFYFFVRLQKSRYLILVKIILIDLWFSWQVLLDTHACHLLTLSIKHNPFIWFIIYLDVHRREKYFYASVLFVLFNLCILVGILIIIHIMFFFYWKTDHILVICNLHHFFTYLYIFDNHQFKSLCLILSSMNEGNLSSSRKHFLKICILQ